MLATAQADLTTVKRTGTMLAHCRHLVQLPALVGQNRATAARLVRRDVGVTQRQVYNLVILHLLSFFELQMEGA